MQLKKYLLRGYRRRIILCIAISLLLISSSLIVYYYFTDKAELYNQLVGNGYNLVNNLAYNSEAGVFAENEVFLETPIMAIMQNEDVLWTAVYNLKGETIKSIFRVKTVDTFLPQNILEQVKREKKAIKVDRKLTSGMTVTDFYAPVILRTSPKIALEDMESTFESLQIADMIGVVRIGISWESFQKHLISIVRNGLFIALFFLILGLPSVFYIERRISEPLLQLDKAVKKVGEGSLDTEMSVTSQDEIGELADSFNKMIKELRDTMGKLEKSEEKYRTLIETAYDAIITFGKEGLITEFNKSAERIYGYARDEIMGKSVDTIIPSEYSRQHRGILANSLKRKERVIGETFEEKGVRKDGQEVPLEISYTILGDQDDYSITAIVRDITDRKRAEELIKKEKVFSESIIETADVAIVGLDLNTKVTLFNKKAEEITGYSRSEVIGKDWLDFISFEKGKAIFEKMVQEILNNKEIQPLESAVINKRGEKRIISSRGTPLKDDEGRIIGILGIGEDITERRKLESQLLQSEKLRALGELAGGVAHNLNNVLAVILGRTQLLKMILAKPIKAERRKSVITIKQGLEVIEKATSDGAETVRRIQEFSRFRSDDLNFKQIDFNQIIDHALEFTKVRWKDDAERQGIHIDILKDTSSLPSVWGSASELREVLINLINNASDAMPKGGRLTIKTYKENRQVTITVKDTGEGIPAEIIDKIFDPFFTTKGPQSTGLGMSVSYGIINRHKGTITVDSAEGQGTTFTIKIPIAEVIKKEIKAEEIPSKIRKASILIIEDEEDVRELLNDILSPYGHKITTASHGKEGVEIFQKNHFDIVFTDLGMPHMSGWEVAKAIKEIDPDSAVILVSGWSVQVNDAKVENYGVDLIINKPFGMHQIVQSVQQAMETKGKKEK